jgi:hypothetical protein
MMMTFKIRKYGQTNEVDYYPLPSPMENKEQFTPVDRNSLPDV